MLPLLALLSGAALASPDDDDDRHKHRIHFEMDFAAAELGATVGGAQDIGSFRAHVEAGEVPLPQTITPEGLFSEHHLPLESRAPCERLLCVHGEAAPASLLVQPDVRWLAQLGFASGLDPSTFERPPLNLVAVVDTSGSMSGTPLETVKQSLLELVDQHLGPADRLSVVLYGDVVETHLVPTAVRDKAALRASIEAIASAGSTNMEAGLVHGFDLARTSRRGFDGATRVMLFTDERPNVGNTSKDGFMELARAGSRDGIGMTTFGVGVQFGAELAAQVSSVRGGNLFFFADPDAMREKLAEDFDTMVVELAYDLDLVVHPAPGLRISGLYGVPGDAVEWTGDGGLRMEIETVFLSRRAGAIYVSFTPEGALPLPALDAVGSVDLAYTPRDGVRTPSTVALPVAQQPGTGLSRGALLVDEATSLVAAAEAHHANDQEGAWRIARDLRARLEQDPDPALAEERKLAAQLEETLALRSGHAGERKRDRVAGLPR